MVDSVLAQKSRWSDRHVVACYRAVYLKSLDDPRLTGILPILIPEGPPVLTHQRQSRIVHTPLRPLSFLNANAKVLLLALPLADTSERCTAPPPLSPLRTQ